MADDPPPADFEVSRAQLGGGGMAHVYACRVHRAHTEQVLADNPGLEGPIIIVQIGPDDPAGPAYRGCKGHLENWPVS